MSNNDYLFDMRIVGLNIKEGKISQKDYKNFIKDLKDVKDKSDILVIDEELEEIETEDSTEEDIDINIE